MNKITAVIIEDEIPAARRLNNTLNELRPEWQITVLPGSVKKSVEWFAENPHPDLVFLDIQLTDGISFTFIYNPQIQISAESETKRSIFREKDKTKRSKKESAQHSKSRNKSFVMTSVSAL